MERLTTAFFDNSYGRKAIESLGKSANNLIVFDAPEILPLLIPNDALENLTEYDWLIIGDPIAADQFIETLLESEFDLFRLDDVQICVGGEAAADRLRLYQIHSDVIPVRNFSVKIWQTLTEYIGGENYLRDLRFFIPQQIEELFGLAQLIKDRGGAIFSQPFFETRFYSLELPKLKALLTGGAIDEFVFTAPEQIYFLRRLLKTENLSSILSDIRCFAADEITRQALSECGIRSVLQK